MTTQHVEPPGVWTTRTARDFLGKLEREFDRMKNEPAQVDHAMNFFVTAEQLLDLVAPGLQNPRRDQIRKLDYSLQVTGWLATGTKHFVIEGKRSNQRNRTTVFRSATWARRIVDEANAWFARSTDELWVYFGPEIAAEAGVPGMSAIDLAAIVLDWWRREIDGLAPTP